MSIITNYILPLIVFFIVIYGFLKKNDVYDSFVSGVVDGMKVIIDIFPVILAMMLAINILTKSGALNFLLSFFSPVISFFNIPTDIFAIMFLRPISSSSSLVIVNNIFSTFGPDSYIGRLASVMQGCTDTTIYILSLYFGSIGIKNSRYALFNGLFADIVGMIASIILVNLLF